MLNSRCAIVLKAAGRLKNGASKPFTMYTRNIASNRNTIPSLLSAEEALELWEVRKEKNIVFLDGSKPPPGVKDRNSYDEFVNGRIPDAQYFDVDGKKLSDPNTNLPHMIPSAESFASGVSELGVSSDSHVIVYGHTQSVTHARVWWMFRLFGHDNVSLINGGFNAWKAAGGETESGPKHTASVQSPYGDFKAALRPDLVVDWQQVLEVVSTGSAQISDARSRGRFLGEAPEPREGVPSGCIPGSLNLPFTELVKDDDFTTFRSKDEIRDKFKEAGVIFGAKQIFSCGTGASAGFLAFAYHLIRDQDPCAIYDGSWTEWASRSDLPK